MAQVRLEALRKEFEDVVAVHDATFEIEDGEFVVLVGPSGCGKSTTLRMIAGLESATEGDLYIGGQRVNKVPPKDRDVAMVFQNYALYPHMTAYDNMAFGLKMRHFSSEEIDERVKRAAEILSIEDILDRKPEALSGGQSQRVAVGRAIVREPQVFLFDEPLSNLDAKLRVQMRTEISKLHSQLGATMIYVTHDQTEAMTMGDRIVVLRDGHIQQIDTPLNLYNQPTNRFVAGFIGSPSMNLLDGTLVRSDGRQFRAVDDTFRIPLDVERAQRFDLAEAPDRRVTLGIRPEDLYVAGSTYVDGPTAVVQHTIDVIEPMGNEIIVYAHIEGIDDAIVARVAPQELPDPGSPIELAFDLSQLHLFSTETGEAISTTDTVSPAA
ncbi:MAG: ABC transporter ATP-binding protein [Salinibacter sp.]